jgi:TetR/AcrR family transcriptional regulator
VSSPTERLPRGRHNLSRDDVAGRQRARILTAFAEVVTEQGYVNTPVAAVLQRAGVSRETFYQQFSSKQDCFVAALEDTVGQLAVAIESSLTADGSPFDRFDRTLRIYLDTLAADPAKARLFLIETYAAGPEAMQRRLQLQARFVDGLAHIFAARTDPQRFACEALVGAVVASVTARFVNGDVDGLAELRPKLVALAGAWLERH